MSRGKRTRKSKPSGRWIVAILCYGKICALICRVWPDRFPGFPKQRGGARLAVLQPIPASSPLLSSAILMSNSHPTTTTTPKSSANFQLIFNDALKTYEKRTKKGLLTHPLAVELQDCNSPSAILAVIHQQVQGLDQSQSNDDRLTKWLDPTVNVLQTLSDTLGEGVSLVIFKT